MSGTTPQPQTGTLIWSDTFESYAVGGITAPWTNNNNINVSTTQAHAGTKALSAGPNGAGGSAYRPFGSNQSQWYADFWMWTNSSGGTAGQFISFPATAPGGGPRVYVDQTGAGKLGNASVTWFTFSVSTTTWHHYLLEVTSAAAGTAKLTVDGTVAGTFSGDTRDGANAFAAYAFVSADTIGPSPPFEYYVDDLSIYSGTTAPTTANLTQIAVEQWAQGTPRAQLTQVATEMWALAGSGTGTQAILTQIALEEWARVAAAQAAQTRAMILA